MVKAIITIDNNTNKILNMVKAQFELKDKSNAIMMMAKQYMEKIMVHQFRPEFIEEMNKKHKEKTIKIKNFKKHFNLK